MKFRVLVNELTLKKEGIKKVKGDVFEVTDNKRAQEILSYKFNGKPVVEPFYDEKILEMEIKELEEMNASLQEENKNLEERLEEANNLLMSNSNDNTEENPETENDTTNDEEKEDEEIEKVHEKSKSKK